MAVAVSIAGEYGIRVTDPVVLRDSFNLRVWLRPAPIVARIPTVTTLGRPRPAEALAREVAVVSHLHEAGAPVVPVSDLLPAKPFERDGVAMSFWTYVEHDPDRRLEPAEVGRALAELHDALRGYPGELPHLGPALEETAHLLDVLAGTGFDAEALAELRAAHGRLSEELRRPYGAVQALHGDAHPGNLLATGEGLLWTDFEETCSGPVGWDLACLRRSRLLDGGEAVRAYGADPEDPAYRLVAEARSLQGTLWQLAKSLRFPEYARQADTALAGWRAATR
ncbi:hypothetical protein Misp01_63210 [Microtetraspora sp. NBRC 13810]|nr:hypothetical protein Misp01_63210 [Microtetraspora sp. NBRC 13810]